MHNKENLDRAVSAAEARRQMHNLGLRDSWQRIEDMFEFQATPEPEPQNGEWWIVERIPDSTRCCLRFGGMFGGAPQYWANNRGVYHKPSEYRPICKIDMEGEL